MDKRNTKLIVNKSGGTSSKGGKTYRVTIPNTWVEQMGLSENNREICITFDGAKIIIEPEISMDEYVLKHKGNKLIKLNFYNNDTLCSRVLADYTDKLVKVENYINDIFHTAFGVNENPSWDDYLSFLEDRCIPRKRAGLKEYLDALGVDEYEPLEIIKKTKGTMAEDNQWIEVLDCDG